MTGRKRVLGIGAVLVLAAVGWFAAVHWEEIRDRGRRMIETGNPLVLLRGGGGEKGEAGEYREIFRKKIAPSETEKSPLKERTLAGARGEPGARDHYGSLQGEVLLFCDYLDHQSYVASAGLEGGTYQNLLSMLSLLSRNPPVISGETRDVYILVKNTAHFYRELKGKRIALVKGILAEEKEALEPLSELLYEWIMTGVAEKRPEIHCSLKDLYIYSSFFLDTLGGKAYLARRDSRTRILVRYYSILILDEANRKGLNHYGIDILPQAALLIDDISNQKGLEYRDRYLVRLKAIQEEYLKKRS
jgi:hypothetical protein